MERERERVEIAGVMTKQSVVVPEAVALTVAAVPPASSPLFPYPPPRSGGGSGGMRKKFLAQLEVAVAGGCNGGRINAWVETMKASSPTHAKAAAALSLADENSTWMVSALDFIQLFGLVFTRCGTKIWFLFCSFAVEASVCSSDVQ